MSQRNQDNSPPKPDLRIDCFKLNREDLEKLDIGKMRKSLENCRLLASRHAKEDWAQHILRFCKDADIVSSTLRE